MKHSNTSQCNASGEGVRVAMIEHNGAPVELIEFRNICQDENPPVTFAVDYKGELAGCIGLVKQTDVYKLTAEIGYWIGEPYRGLGIATKAVELITEYGFRQLNLVRIYSGVFDFNVASQRVLEKSGFKLEGIFEKSIIKNGRICDEFRYAKTKIILH